MTIILTNQRERSRFFRFAVVGAIGAVIDFGVMEILVTFFHTAFTLAGTISFIAAVFSNFTWNRYWTYPDSRSKPIARQLLMFTIVSVGGLLIRVPTLALVEPVMIRLADIFPVEAIGLTPTFVGDNATLALAVFIVMFWNFFVNRYWTYNDVE